MRVSPLVVRFSRSRSDPAGLHDRPSALVPFAAMELQHLAPFPLRRDERLPEVLEAERRVHALGDLHVRVPQQLRRDMESGSPRDVEAEGPAQIVDRDPVQAGTLLHLLPRTRETLTRAIEAATGDEPLRRARNRL